MIHQFCLDNVWLHLFKHYCFCVLAMHAVYAQERDTGAILYLLRIDD